MTTQGERYPLLVLLDIDGVLNGVAPGLPPERLPEGGVIWPIPMANALLQAIQQDWRLYPLWCTSWYKRAPLWNDRAGTPRWPIAHITRRAHVDRWFPGVLPEKRYDWKLASALYYRRRFPTRKIIWIEDGFFEETKRWAASDPLVRLVDTTEATIRALLLADGGIQKAVQTFLDVYVFGQNDERLERQKDACQLAPTSLKPRSSR